MIDRYWLNRQCPCCSPGDIYVKVIGRRLYFICADCGKTLVSSGSVVNEHLEKIYDILLFAEKEENHLPSFFGMEVS